MRTTCNDGYITLPPKKSLQMLQVQLREAGIEGYKVIDRRKRIKAKSQKFSICNIFKVLEENNC